MANIIPIVATITAVVLFIAAVWILSMERFVASGTLFLFAAIAIYIRELTR